ncbi:MAG: leucine-rich repeat protein [Prevotellaceae bacterium]|jgi:hypothetical protein|nr:leucine-rich repeat protein [Prevotellaceae bacterium]
MKTKSFYSFALVATLLCLCSANRAEAYDFAAYNGQAQIYYNITSAVEPFKVEVTYATEVTYNDYSGTVVIPDTVTNLGVTYVVTAIGEWAFAECSGLNSVTIPNSVTWIGSAAFRSCSGLTGIDVAVGNPHYSSIEGVLFNKDKETLILYPAGKAGSYIIPESVETIGGAAFTDCDKLTSVTIGNSVTWIGDMAFYNCSGLTGTLTIPNSVISIEAYAFQSCSKLDSVTIGNSVKMIGYHAFRECTSLTAVTIGNSVTSIGSSAFRECSLLASITIYAEIPPAVESNTFGDVSTDIPVHIPCGTKTAYEGADGWENFTNYEEDIFPVLTVESADADKGTASITQPQASCADNGAIITATPALKHVFKQWSDGSIENPYTVTVTKDTTLTAQFESVRYDFAAVNNGQKIYYMITSHTDPRTVEVTYATDDTFNDYSGAVVIPDTVTNLGVTYTVTAIGNSAFRLSTGLTAVTIPESVETIGNYAFSYCSGLTGTLTVPDSVTSIGNSAFSACNKLDSVTIGDSVKTIGERAFSGCSGLTSVTIGNSVETIGNLAFYNCSGLTGTLTIPNSVKTIGIQAFQSCNGLTSVTIGNSVKTIGTAAFRFCRGLTDINVAADNQHYSSREGVLFNKAQNTLIQYPGSKSGSYTVPNSVTSIGYNAFASCSGLNSVTIGNSVETIEGWAFQSCSNLASVTIGNSVKMLGDYAFQNCTDLTAVTIGSSVETIGEWAFSGCSKLASATIYAETPPTVVDDAFFSVSTEILVYVPCRSVSAYQSAAVWSNFTNINASPIYKNENDIICQNELPYAWQNDTVFPVGSVSGEYIFNRQTLDGCDSIVVLNLTVLPQSSSTINVTICYGATYTENGFNENATDTYTQVLQNVNGCDSIVTLNLTVLPEVPITTFDVTICFGTTYNENGFNENTTGAYTQELQNVNGCDSIVKLNLTVNPLPEVPVYANRVHKGNYTLPVVENGVWTDNDEVVTVASASGTYILTIIDLETGCKNSTTLTVEITTALGFYPNPVRDELFISGVSGDTSVEITDLSGHTVGTWHAESPQTGVISIDVSYLTKGVYLVRIGRVTEKIVKE